MFDFIRNHTRLALGLLLLLIIPSFVFFGVEGYSKFNDGTSMTVAKVDGHNISRGEWDNVHQRYMERARQQMPGVDSRQFDTPEARRATLDALVRERVLLAAATALHLSPSDARLQRLFATDPQFAQLRNPDGSVNREILAMQGMSSEMFAQRLRQEFATQQVLAGVTRSTLAPTSIVNASVDPLLQRREVQFQRFEPAVYRDKVQPSEAEIEAFYKAQSGDFKAPEQANIEYVVLDLDTLTKASAPSDEELRKFYADNAARFTAAAERRASHILINADKALSAAEKQKAKTRAEGLLAEVRKNPAQFAELARKNSQDGGSATQGGDLGFFGRGSMVKPFEDAAFSMKVGDISDLIETDYGYHIITVTGAKGGEKRAFEEVRAEIDGELRRTTALRKWPELAEQFTNTVYEQSDSLQPVITKLKLEKKTATVQRTPAPGAAGPLASPKFLDAVFGNEAVANKRNTDAVEVGPNQLVSARVVQHTPSRVLALADVKDQVRDRLVQQKATAMAIQEGKARLAALQAASAQAEPLPGTGIVSRGQPQGLPKEALDAAMQADPTKLPYLTGVSLSTGGYVVLRVGKVLPREPVPGGDETLRTQYAQAWATAESDAYLAALKRRFKAEVKPAASTAAVDAAAASASAARR
jgi:peptidyl-prolyl cis-trans isomerase D